eukprot:Pgem_evm1s10347
MFKLEENDAIDIGPFPFTLTQRVTKISGLSNVRLTAFEPGKISESVIEYCEATGGPITLHVELHRHGHPTPKAEVIIHMSSFTAKMKHLPVTVDFSLAKAKINVGLITNQHINIEFGDLSAESGGDTFIDKLVSSGMNNILDKIKFVVKDMSLRQMNKIAKEDFPKTIGITVTAADVKAAKKGLVKGAITTGLVLGGTYIVKQIGKKVFRYFFPSPQVKKVENRTIDTVASEVVAVVNDTTPEN